MEQRKSLFGKPIIDITGLGIITLTNLHSHIHSGVAFASRCYGATVASSGYLYQEFIVPANIELHLKNLAVYTDGSKMKIDILEAPTITDGTTPALVRNLNRSPKFNDDPAGIKIYSDPSSISGGTSLDEFMLASGAVNIGAGGEESEVEWIFYESLKYVVRLQNLDAGTAVMYIRGVFYITDI